MTHLALPEKNIFLDLQRAGAWSKDGAGWTRPRSFGFVCPVCYKTWGLLLTEGQLPVFQTSPCEKHLSYARERVAGSLLYSYSIMEAGNFDEPLLETLPLDLLEREFYLHLLHYESELENEQ